MKQCEQVPVTIFQNFHEVYFWLTWTFNKHFLYNFIKQYTRNKIVSLLIRFSVCIATTENLKLPIWLYLCIPKRPTTKLVHIFIKKFVVSVVDNKLKTVE